MKLLRITVFFFVFIVLSAGCSSVRLVHVGKDTYMMAKGASSWGWYSGSVLKAELFQEADEFCRGKNLHLMLVDSRSASTSWQQAGSAEIVFRCLEENDPEYRRPEYRAPDRLELLHK